jgi:hypothetical protein
MNDAEKFICSMDEQVEFLSYIVEAIKKHQREYPR